MGRLMRIFRSIVESVVPAMRGDPVVGTPRRVDEAMRVIDALSR